VQFIAVECSSMHYNSAGPKIVLTTSAIGNCCTRIFGGAEKCCLIRLEDSRVFCIKPSYMSVNPYKARSGILPLSILAFPDPTPDPDPLTQLNPELVKIRVRKTE
jgi:hypothetical protein